MAINSEQPITLRRLEDHLWAAADLFRNKVSNQKDYILALLFFKRASDLYADETAAALEELGDLDGAEDLARDRAFHVLQIPEGHSWDDVRNTDRPQMGSALNDALAAIGRANPKQLAGVFERTDFNNTMALPADDLAAIIDHFHGLGRLGVDRVPADMLGQAYEWLIAKFAAVAGKGGGEFYTPAEVGDLIARLVEPESEDHIYDPTCGSGGLLLQCLNRASRPDSGVNPRSLFLYGQELNPETWAIARMNMLLHGAGDAADIKLGDTLMAPAFIHGDGVRKFDVVVANPPFGTSAHLRLRDSGGDPFGRIKHFPAKKRGEMAFVQHMVASMSDGARLAVVLPTTAFSRKGAEMNVRADLIKADLVDSIIQLPGDLFYGTQIPACVLVCRRSKPEARQQRVLMIDATPAFDRRDTKNVLTAEGIEQVVDVFMSGREEDGYSIWVDTGRMEASGYNLSVRRYLNLGTEDLDVGTWDIDRAIEDYREARRLREQAEADVDRILLMLEEGS